MQPNIPDRQTVEDVLINRPFNRPLHEPIIAIQNWLDSRNKQGGDLRHVDPAHFEQQQPEQSRTLLQPPEHRPQNITEQGAAQLVGRDFPEMNALIQDAGNMFPEQDLDGKVLEIASRYSDFDLASMAAGHLRNRFGELPPELMEQINILQHPERSTGEQMRQAREVLVKTLQMELNNQAKHAQQQTDPTVFNSTRSHLD